MFGNRLMAVLWTVALLLGALALAIPHWQPDAFTWDAWKETFMWPGIGAIVFVLLFLDWDWKRKLFRWHGDKR